MVKPLSFLDINSGPEMSNPAVREQVMETVRAVAEAAAHDQVGHRDDTRGLDLRPLHGMPLDREAHGLEQLGRACGVRSVVARRHVRGHAYQFAQERHLVGEAGVDARVERGDE